MKVLNRPMFRMGGPIKEGIMSGIKEPRQKYQEAGQVFKNVENLLATDQPRGDVLQGAAELGIASPYKQNVFKPYMKKTVTKPTNLDTNVIDESILDSDFATTVRNPESGKIVMQEPQGLSLEAKAKLNLISATEYAQLKKAEEDAKNNEKTSIFTTEDDTREQASVGNVKPDVNLPGGEPDEPKVLSRKDKVNSILEGLGYDRASKNALYDAMIKAGQRISRTGLGADNLVSDVIAETSQSYDKPEKLREAANLMQVQQDLKLDQIEASKTGGTLKQNYDFYISQGDSKEVAEKKARSLPTTISEKFNASKSNTDSGKVYNVTMEITKEGFFGDKYKDSYNGRVAKKYETVSEFIESKDFKGDGVYNFKGEAFLIENGKVTKRQIIQPKVDKEGFFS